jgi:hypothetical protein
VTEVLEARRLLSGTPVATAAFDVDAPQQAIRFDLDPAANLPAPQADWFSVHNLNTQSEVPFAHTSAGQATTLTFPTDIAGAPNTPATLPSGNYDVRLDAHAAGKIAGDGFADAELKTFFLAGDANRDRKVDLADFGILRAHFGDQGVTHSQGDLNYDGTVNLADHGILRANFGTTLLTPPPNDAHIIALNNGHDAITVTRGVSATIGTINTLPGGFGESGTAGGPVGTSGSGGTGGSSGTSAGSGTLGSTPDQWIIYRSPTGGNDYRYAASIPGNQFSWTDHYVDEGTRYWYRMRPWTEAEGLGHTTREQYAVTTLQPPTQVRSSAINDTEVTVEWNPAAHNTTGYRITRVLPDGTRGATWTIDATTARHTFTDPEASQASHYEVEAFTSDQTSAPAGHAGGHLTAPTGVTVRRDTKSTYSVLWAGTHPNTDEVHLYANRPGQEPKFWASAPASAGEVAFNYAAAGVFTLSLVAFDANAAPAGSDDGAANASAREESGNTDADKLPHLDRTDHILVMESAAIGVGQNGGVEVGMSPSVKLQDNITWRSEITKIPPHHKMLVDATLSVNVGGTFTLQVGDESRSVSGPKGSGHSLSLHFKHTGDTAEISITFNASEQPPAGIPAAKIAEVGVTFASHLVDVSVLANNVLSENEREFGRGEASVTNSDLLLDDEQIIVDLLQDTSFDDDHKPVVDGLSDVSWTPSVTLTKAFPRMRFEVRAEEDQETDGKEKDKPEDPESIAQFGEYIDNGTEWLPLTGVPRAGAVARSESSAIYKIKDDARWFYHDWEEARQVPWHEIDVDHRFVADNRFATHWKFAEFAGTDGANWGEDFHFSYGFVVTRSIDVNFGFGFEPATLGVGSSTGNEWTFGGQPPLIIGMKNKITRAQGWVMMSQYQLAHYSDDGELIQVHRSQGPYHILNDHFHTSARLQREWLDEDSEDAVGLHDKIPDNPFLRGPRLYPSDKPVDE